MKLFFCCEGDAGKEGLQKRLSALSADVGEVSSMAAEDTAAVRVWYGANPPEGTHAWIMNASGQVLDGHEIVKERKLALIGAVDVASGVSQQMNVVFERGQSPVYFPSQSEMEGYVAERLLSLQEIDTNA